MKILCLSAALALMTAACGQAGKPASATQDAPHALPRCSVAVDPAGYPQYAGTYGLFIDGIYAQHASLLFRAKYPQYAGVLEATYQLRCATLAGWPSYAVCAEDSGEAFKFGARYSGEATLSVSGPNGQTLDLGAMSCF